MSTSLIGTAKGVRTIHLSEKLYYALCGEAFLSLGGMLLRLFLFIRGPPFRLSCFIHQPKGVNDENY